MDYKELSTNTIILITGVAGFIGASLARRLLKDKIRVIGVDNLNDYYDVSLKKRRIELLESANFKFIKGDIANKEFLLKVFKDNKIDIVVNLAAQAGVRYSIEKPDVYLQSNIIGFFNILECCRYFPVEHLVFASSSSVYGNSNKVPFSTEDMVDRPVSFYAATKKSNELMAYSYSKLYGIRSTGLRFFTVYGPWGRPDMAYFKFANKIVKNQTIQVFNHGDLYRDFTYIDDIVEGIYRILGNIPLEDKDKVRYKVYNIGSNKPEKLLDFIEILENVLGKCAKKEFVDMQPGDVFQTYADISDMERDFDFRPNTSLKQGLEAFGKWFKTEY